MQEKSFINLLKNYLVFHNRKAIGYSEEEIKKIEKLYDIEVKGDFREFLRIAGRNSGGILGYGYLVFYNPFFTPRKNLIFQEFDRNMFYKIGMKNILKSKIFVFSVEDETIEYFIKTSDDDFKVYKYYENYDKIEEVSMNFDEYMRLLIYIKEPNNDNFIGNLLPKEIKNLNKNITPQKIDNYLSEDKKNDNNFIYLLKKYLEKNGKQSTGYSDEEIKEIEKFYEIIIKDDLKDFFRMAGRSDGGLLNKNDLIFYKNLTVREHVIFQWNFDEKCIIDNELYEEIKEYFLVFLINKSLYYLISIEKDVEKLYVYSYNMETKELTHTGKTFNEFMVDLVHKTNPNFEVGEEKIGEMIDIKIDDDEASEELEEMKIIGYHEEKALEREEAEKFVLTEDIKPELTQEQITKKEADKKFDETRNWLGSRTERTLYKGSVFLVNRFVERIKDFDTDLKERVYRFIDSYTKDWISTITFDTGETYELEEALKKFREIMGLYDKK